MKFKNQFEKTIYEIAKNIFGDENTQIEHNKVIVIEDKTSRSTVSFSGPPKKEIDVLSVTLSNATDVQLLISCKDFSKSKAEPAHIQEWCSVLNTMNKHSKKSKYIGIVVSSSGFTSGCESWASSDNIGLIPPIKGNNTKFEEKYVIAMFKRFCTALLKRLKFPLEDIFIAPNLFDFCYSITSDFEGFINSDTTPRYKIVNKEWNSNFSELVHFIVGKIITSLIYTNEEFILIIEDNLLLKYSNNVIQFGKIECEIYENVDTPTCTKNIENEAISFEKIKELVIGKKITSAADFQNYIELGINGKLNLGLISPNRIHIMIFSEIQNIKDE